MGPIKSEISKKIDITSANNHNAGFVPSTANIFRNILGLSDAKWENKEEERREKFQSHDDKQHSLSEFMS